ncbi:MAG: hypothetical protein GX557_01080 [Chloroflexi bacterium]|nr:hypothetical protein [Chloroflexota bacterium]
MTTKLYQVGQAAVTVADPQGPLSKTRKRLVGQERALDGTLNTLHVANKWTWELVWLGLTAAEYSALWAELDRQENMSFQPPDEATVYTVAVVGEPQVEVNGWGQYKVRAVLEQV